MEGPHDSSSGTEDAVMVMQAIADDATVNAGHVLIGPVDIGVIMYQQSDSKQRKNESQLKR